MAKPNRDGYRGQLRTLGYLRLALCVIALILCGTIGFSTVSLMPWIRQGGAQTDGQLPIPSVVMTEPTDLPAQTTETATESSIETTTESVTEPPDKAVPGDERSDETKNPDDLGKKPSAEGVPKDSDQAQPKQEKENLPTETPTQEPPVQLRAAAQDTLEKVTTETEEETQTLPTNVAVSNSVDLAADTQPEPAVAPGWALPVLVVSAVLLALDLVGIAVCSMAIRKIRIRMLADEGQTVDAITRTISAHPRRAAGSGAIAVGQLHNIGARPSQQDSSGVAKVKDGMLAVVADGMGGLADGDKVSQKIVCTMLEYSKSVRPGQMDGVLERMLSGVNNVINQTFGQNGPNRCGSTLLAVLVQKNCFHWIAVGDSHIYLYHAGSLTQLNQEHNRGQDLLRQGIAGQLTFDEVRADPKKSGLTSFLGMGRLKYVERSLYSIPVVPGDRIVLMTDGVFNALSDETICAILSRTPDVEEAARVLEKSVIDRALPRQDNFTAVILGI